MRLLSEDYEVGFADARELYTVDDNTLLALFAVNSSGTHVRNSTVAETMKKRETVSLLVNPARNALDVKNFYITLFDGQSTYIYAQKVSIFMIQALYALGKKTTSMQF